MHPALLAFAARCAAARPAVGSTDVVPVAGLPGVRALECRGQATGLEVRALVRSTGQRARLRHPVRVRAHPSERPPAGDLNVPQAGAVLRTAHADWYTYDVAQRALEVERVEADGREVQREVPADHTYVMRCACGRLRYAPRRALAKIYACRVCTYEGRCARRAATQRAAYAPRQERATREQLRTRARELRAAGASLSKIAAACGKSISWASRILRRAPC